MFKSVSEMAKKWGVSERTVRNYCASAKIEGAVLKGKTWFIPESTTKPQRQKIVQRDLLAVLTAEKMAKLSGGIYHKVQIELTYNSNHIEGSTLTHEQTRYIFETNTLGKADYVKIDDILETANHFRCIDLIIDNAGKQLSESFIKLLHFTLKTGTSDSRLDWFNVGEYKKLPNEVGGRETVAPAEVHRYVKNLLDEYNKIQNKSLEDLIEFHHAFEKIHPFQDGNGRIGRLILFKECLKHKIVPFIISDDLKYFYYRGLSEWEKERGYLTDTCLTAQDRFKKCLDYFEIKY